MARTVNVNFKLDSDVKKSMEQACSDMGLSMSAAFTIFAKKIVRERRIPFEITANDPNDPFYSAANMERLKRAAAQMEKTGGTVHELGALPNDD